MRSFHLQELGREQDPKGPAPSDGQEGCGYSGSGFICIFNAWRKSRFFALCTQLQYRVSLGSG